MEIANLKPVSLPLVTICPPARRPALHWLRRTGGEQKRDSVHGGDCFAELACPCGNVAATPLDCRAGGRPAVRPCPVSVRLKRWTVSLVLRRMSVTIGSAVVSPKCATGWSRPASPYAVLRAATCCGAPATGWMTPAFTVSSITLPSYADPQGVAAAMHAAWNRCVEGRPAVAGPVALRNS